MEYFPFKGKKAAEFSWPLCPKIGGLESSTMFDLLRPQLHVASGALPASGRGPPGLRALLRPLRRGGARARRQARRIPDAPRRSSPSTIRFFGSFGL